MQGSEFISTLFRTVYQHLEIKFTTTTTYNPAETRAMYNYDMFVETRVMKVTVDILLT